MALHPPIATLAAMFCMAAASLHAQSERTLFREFFVSPTGSDANAGTSSKPFQTLEKARQAVRAAIPGMAGDIAVTIHGGTYPVRKTITFGPEDSATGTHRILYRAAKGETPVFTGGVPVTGWKPHKDGIWKAPLNRNEKLRSLYVDNARAVMANSGKKVRAQGGWGTYTVTAGQAPWAWQSGKTADGIQYNAADLPKITHNVSDVEIENQTTWNKNFIGVREIATEGDKYHLQTPATLRCHRPTDRLERRTHPRQRTDHPQRPRTARSTRRVLFRPRGKDALLHPPPGRKHADRQGGRSGHADARATRRPAA